MQTPIFVLNSKYDTWQAGQIIGAAAFKCNDNITSCPGPIKKFWVDYGNEMVALYGPLGPDFPTILTVFGAGCAWACTQAQGAAFSCPRSNLADTALTCI